MICPTCMGEMIGIGEGPTALEICPRCKGAWLDRLEIERMMRSAVGLKTRMALHSPEYSAIFNLDDYDRGTQARREADIPRFDPLGSDEVEPYS